MPTDEKSALEDRSKEKDAGQQAKAYLDCVGDEKKQRMDDFIQALKTMPPGFGFRNPTANQESQATEGALDACQELPGAQYFVRSR